MFCPKCGDELIEVRGSLTCVRGNMPLSPRMEQRLKECYVTKTRVPRGHTFENGVGGKWFCPGCGVAAPEEQKGIVRCPQCGHSLNEFIYELVELHPHYGR